MIAQMICYLNNALSPQNSSQTLNENQIKFLSHQLLILNRIIKPMDQHHMMKIGWTDFSNAPLPQLSRLQLGHWLFQTIQKALQTSGKRPKVTMEHTQSSSQTPN
ncbi:hypothetical protein O181_072055 [Austropuccinia psidii MF-1]|uniref:Uncharacterized protein n=1 Tax=Austropuccinia psidii MF-1 TaxID=1389203 RepID=A0A9Q3F7X1_9BASI|nr:hypothetical protein [Austropuccinia psidii MF-1]